MNQYKLGIYLRRRYRSLLETGQYSSKNVYIMSTVSENFESKCHIIEVNSWKFI